jgi:hypothetical protein
MEQVEMGGGTAARIGEKRDAYMALVGKHE